MTDRQKGSSPGGPLGRNRQPRQQGRHQHGAGEAAVPEGEGGSEAVTATGGQCSPCPAGSVRSRKGPTGICRSSRGGRGGGGLDWEGWEVRGETGRDSRQRPLEGPWRAGASGFPPWASPHWAATTGSGASLHPDPPIPAASPRAPSVILWPGGASATKLPLLPTQSSQALARRTATSWGPLSASQL